MEQKTKYEEQLEFDFSNHLDDVNQKIFSYLRSKISVPLSYIVKNIQFRINLENSIGIFLKESLSKKDYEILVDNIIESIDEYVR